MNSLRPLSLCIGVLALSCSASATADIHAPVARSWGKSARTTAYGAVRLEKLRTSGIARLLLPYPTHAARQRVLGPPALELVAWGGPSLRRAISGHEVVPHPVPNAEKHMLRVDLTLEALPQSAVLGWSVPVELGAHAADLSRSIPLGPARAIPAAAVPWTKPSPMIQSQSRQIVDLAQLIRGRAVDLQSLVRETLQEMALRRRPLEQWSHEDFQNDALSFLETGKGDCVANANLFAALMRANGVPTRVVSVIQRGTAIVQNMHFVNEYFVPGQGWAHVEPQGLALQTPRTDAVHTGVVTHEMEAHGDGFMHYRGVIRHTLIGQEIDPAGAPTASPALHVSPGLELASDRGRSVTGIHGAP